MKSEYQQLMDCIDFLLEQMASLRAMAKPADNDRRVEIAQKRRIQKRADEMEGWAVLIQCLAITVQAEKNPGAPTPGFSE
ncbi:MAG: hypothetical protein RPR91_04910 [Colwellia sp.]